MPTLVIGNKLYSSWSLRPWILMSHFGIAFEEVVVPMDQPTSASEIRKYSPTGKVPVLIDGDVVVWESIAIMEYVGDAYGAPVWPADRKARARARAVSAEMHAGFQALRSACPMNLGRKVAHRDRGEGVMRDIARVTQLFRETRETFGAGGRFLFGEFSAADAMFAPVVTRFETYSVPVDEVTRAYMDAILSLPAYQAWLAAALDEQWVIPSSEVDEPLEIYRRAG